MVTAPRRLFHWKNSKKEDARLFVRANGTQEYVFLESPHGIDPWNHLSRTLLGPRRVTGKIIIDGCNSLTSSAQLAKFLFDGEQRKIYERKMDVGTIPTMTSCYEQNEDTTGCIGHLQTTMIFCEQHRNYHRLLATASPAVWNARRSTCIKCITNVDVFQN